MTEIGLEQQLSEKREEAFRGAIRAVVVYDGIDYIAAAPEDPQVAGRGSITLSKVLWLGPRAPRKGQVIELAQIEEFGKGWRANLGRPILK